MADDSPATRLPKEDLVNLYRALAMLYVYDRNFKKAIKIYMLLDDTAVFGVIERYQLFHLVKDRIIELMKINADLAIRILLDNEDSATTETVVTQLSHQPKLQMAYLNRLMNRGQILPSQYSDLLIRLYAEHDRPKLLPFLKNCSNYRLDVALEICRRKQFVEETIEILDRSGARLEALDMLINKLDRIDRAILFCTTHEDDVELWDRLIELSMTKPAHVSRLLATAGTFIDPLSVIRKIPLDMDIPGLQRSLLKVLKDSELQAKLLRDSQNVIVIDIIDLFRKRISNRALHVGMEDSCIVCSGHLTGNVGEIRVFSCGHSLHSKCIADRLGADHRAQDSKDFDPTNPFEESASPPPIDGPMNLAKLGLTVSGISPTVCPSCFGRDVAALMSRGGRQE